MDWSPARRPERTRQPDFHVTRSAGSIFISCSLHLFQYCGLRILTAGCVTCHCDWSSMHTRLIPTRRGHTDRPRLNGCAHYSERPRHYRPTCNTSTHDGTTQAREASHPPAERDVRGLCGAASGQDGGADMKLIKTEEATRDELRYAVRVRTPRTSLVPKYHSFRSG